MRRRDGPLAEVTLRALCHNRVLDPAPRLEVLRGSIADRAMVDEAMADVTHVLHLATTKETPETVMDVAVKGLFLLQESCRTSPTFEQLILVGGDAAVGHFFYPRDRPLTEADPHAAYPGCYALSKVLEEVMVEQYGIQYDLNVCCLRAPWIMEKDDFRFQLSFGDDVFGGPRWRDLVPVAEADAYVANGTVPVMLDPEGRPVKRNFVHVEDLVDAIAAALGNPPRGVRRSTSAWTSRSTTESSAPTSPQRVVSLPLRSARRTTRCGSTTRRRNFASAGARGTTWCGWSRRRGHTSALRTTRGSSGIRGSRQRPTLPPLTKGRATST